MLRIHLPKIKSTGYSTKITTWKTGKYLKRKTRGQVLAHLLAWYWQRNFPCELTENCSAIFDQSSCAILLTWYCWLYFFLGISCGYPSDGSLKIFDKTLEGVNIIQFRLVPVTFGSMHFFLFQSLDVKASENRSRSQVFQLDLL